MSSLPQTSPVRLPRPFATRQGARSRGATSRGRGLNKYCLPDKSVGPSGLHSKVLIADSVFTKLLSVIFERP